MGARLPQADGRRKPDNGCNGSTQMNSKERRKAERKRLPPWFKTSLPTGVSQIRYNETKVNVFEHGLHTVCEEARCPNIHDCWGRGTATFMIAGDICTRGCRFCAINTQKNPPALNPNEPEELAEAVVRMGVSHAVITVVNRDDLPDGGANHYKNCILAVHEKAPEIGLELLCSDLDGKLNSLEYLLHDLPLQVFAHNVETVRRLTPRARDPRATFEQSILILKKAKELRPDIMTKSSIMLGLGETEDDIIETFRELRNGSMGIRSLWGCL